MFTLPHNTIAYLYKEAIDMRLGMFGLQGVIAEQLSQPMVRGIYCIFVSKPAGELHSRRLERVYQLF